MDSTSRQGFILEESPEVPSSSSAPTEGSQQVWTIPLRASWVIKLLEIF